MIGDRHRMVSPEHQVDRIRGKCDCLQLATDKRARIEVLRKSIHFSLLYEAGTNQPTLDVLRALAIALAVTTDDLVFNEDERGPADDTLRMHLAALDQLDPDERATIRALIEGALLRHQARRLSAS